MRSPALTTYIVAGTVRVVDLYDCVERYHAEGVTPLTLWDLTRADLSVITTEQISDFAQYVRYLIGNCKGGKTAIICDTPHDFSLDRMFETQLEIAGLQVEMRVCLSITEAENWLGIDERTTAKSTIHKIGSTIQNNRSRQTRSRTILKVDS